MRLRGHDDSSGEEPPRIASDTTEDAAHMQIAMWRAMTSVQKAQLVTGLTVAVQQLCLSGIRMRHPDASERECLLRLAIIKLGRDLAVRVYPEVASLKGL